MIALAATLLALGLADLVPVSGVRTPMFLWRVGVAAGVAAAAGPVVHDARVAGLCLAHGVRELWTADRDFARFPALKVRNPLIA